MVKRPEAGEKYVGGRGVPLCRYCLNGGNGLDLEGKIGNILKYWRCGQAQVSENSLQAMSTLNIYLYFKGNCEKAFDFYKSIFGGEYAFVGRYKDIPQAARENFPYCTDEQIMHITLPISKETLLMGADWMDSKQETSESKRGFSLYVNTDNKKEAERLFDSLSDEGEIIVPIGVQFWGSYYGLCIDKFGISWKISCSANENA